MKVKQVLVIILKKNASNNYKIEDKEWFLQMSYRKSKAQIYFLVQKCSSSEDFRFSLFRKESESPSGNRNLGQVKT